MAPHNGRGIGALQPAAGGPRAAHLQTLHLSCDDDLDQPSRQPTRVNFKGKAAAIDLRGVVGAQEVGEGVDLGLRAQCAADMKNAGRNAAKPKEFFSSGKWHGPAGPAPGATSK
jgi:hypothetical protein